jgi:transcriptional/translational regulatory protein YebC/TACO1
MIIWRCGYQDFEKVGHALADAKMEMAQAEWMMIASQTGAAAGENAEMLQKIVEGLESNDDVQNVYTSAETV